MQTWLVHMREPHRLFRELGFSGFLAFQLIVGGNALVALAHPALLAGLIWTLVAMLSQGLNSTFILWLSYYLLIAAAGYFVSASFGWRGLSQRGVPNKARILICTPVRWLLLSAAAWWATIDLIRAPFRWKKTEHGLDQGSRQGCRTRSLLMLERHLTDLKRSGQLSQIWV